MANPSQLFLLADHIKLSLLERQRAISLNLEPNSQDGEISRSLDSLRDGIDSIEVEKRQLQSSNGSGVAELSEQLSQLHSQFRELSSQFHGESQHGEDDGAAVTVSREEGADLKQPVPEHPSKSVRFMDNSNDADDEDPNRRTLFQPYRDSPSPGAEQDQSELSNQQIHLQHSATMRDQDEQLDRLGQSIGRQHELSIQIGDELEGHVALLDGVDGDVDRHQTRMDRAKRRLDGIRRKAGDNWSLMTIVGLIIILVILIVILK